MTEQTVEQLNNQIKGAQAQLQAYKTTINELTDAILVARTNLQLTHNAYVESANSLKQMTTSCESAKAELETVKKELDALKVE